MATPSRGARNAVFSGGRLRPIWRLLIYSSMVLTALIAVTAGSFFTLALVLLITWGCRRFLDERTMTSLGFSLHRGWLTSLAQGLLVGAAAMGGIFAIQVSAGWIEVQAFAWNEVPAGTIAGGLLGAAFGVIVIALLEETIFRGYVLQTLEEGYGTWPAVAVSSLLFGLLHLMNPSLHGWWYLIVPIGLTMLGLVFALAYLVCRSLWLPLALHFAWNFFMYDVFALTGASAEQAHLFATRVTGPSFWVGLPNSAFGPEVGALGILAMLASLLVLWRQVPFVGGHGAPGLDGSTRLLGKTTATNPTGSSTSPGVIDLER